MFDKRTVRAVLPSIANARSTLAATVVVASIGVSGFAPVAAAPTPSRTIYGVVASQPNAIAKLQSCVAVVTGASFTPAIVFAPGSAVKTSTVTFSFFDKTNMALGQISLTPPYQSTPMPAGTDNFTCAIEHEELADGSIFPAAVAATHGNAGLVIGGVVVGVGLIAAVAGGHGGGGGTPQQQQTQPPTTPTPIATPSPTPSASPTVAPSPTASPSAAPSVRPSPSASAAPTVSPSASAAPTVSPTASASPRPSPSASGAPIVTPSPTASPTVRPSPTVAPTASPVPTAAPTASPVPTAAPTASPVPTAVPTASPAPTAVPTVVPTASPVPTAVPTVVPTASPVPTAVPTASPTASPAGPIILTPNLLTFLSTGVALPSIISETGYSGTFSLQTDGCASGGANGNDRIASVSPTSGIANNAALSVTALDAGSCTFTFTDTYGQPGSLMVSVTTTSVVIDRKHPAPRKVAPTPRPPSVTPAVPPTLTVIKPTPQPGATPRPAH